jgi:hypothetical protein
MELAARATELGGDTLRCALGKGTRAAGRRCGRGPALSPWRTGRSSRSTCCARAFAMPRQFWHEAASVPGMSAHHAQMTQFFARQWLGLLTPANWLPTNPVVLKDAVESGGAHLLQGLRKAVQDLAGRRTPKRDFQIGRDVAATPGRVVMRNHLVELIRYEPQTAQVHPEPILIVPVVDHEVLHPRPVAAQLAGALPGRPGPHGVHAVLAQPRRRRRANWSMDDYLHLRRLRRPRRAINAIVPRRRCTPWATAWAARCWPLPPPRWPVVNWTAPALPALASLTPAGGADRLLRAGRTGPVHRREPGRLLDQMARAGLPQRRADGRLLPVPALARPGVDAPHARIPDGRARPAQRPDGLERRHHAHAGAHAPRVPDRAVPAQRAGQRPLPRCTAGPVSLSDLRCRCSWSAPSATMSRPGARSTSCTTCARPRSPSCWPAGGHNAGIVSEPGHAHRTTASRPGWPSAPRRHDAPSPCRPASWAPRPDST